MVENARSAWKAVSGLGRIAFSAHQGRSNIGKESLCLGLKGGSRNDFSVWPICSFIKNLIPSCLTLSPCSRNNQELVRSGARVFKFSIPSERRWDTNRSCRQPRHTIATNSIHNQPICSNLGHFFKIWPKSPKPISWILHELEAFICKALKGEAIVDYREPLITPQMEASGPPEVENWWEKRSSSFFTIWALFS